MYYLLLRSHRRIVDMLLIRTSIFPLVISEMCPVIFTPVVEAPAIGPVRTGPSR